MIIKIQRSVGLGESSAHPRFLILITSTRNLARELCRRPSPKADFFDLPAEILPGYPAPDTFQYALTVNNGPHELPSRPPRKRLLKRFWRSCTPAKGSSEQQILDKAKRSHGWQVTRPHRMISPGNAVMNCRLGFTKCIFACLASFAVASPVPICDCSIWFGNQNNSR